MVKIEEKLLSKTEKKQLKVESKNDLLNSFFTSDIEKVISNFDKVKKESPLKKYLSGNLNKYGSRDDLNTNPSIIKNTLNPLNFPDSCWPSQYSLNLMQQFAVNTIIKTARNGEKEHNLFSVNGPPGTGKTTLLRDALAGIITERAKELIKFKNPLDAFDDAGEIATNNPNFSHSIVTSKDNLNIAEILIASSNNGAVENITNELPLKTVIAPFENEISYFKNAINQDENWGLLSATLGNKKNKETFTKTYWQYWKDKKPVKQGLQIYLKEQSLVSTSKWKDVTKRFEHQLNLVQDEKNRLEKIRLLSLKAEEINNNFKSLKNQLEKFKLEFAQIVAVLNNLTQQI